MARHLPVVHWTGLCIKKVSSPGSVTQALLMRQEHGIDHLSVLTGFKAIRAVVHWDLMGFGGTMCSCKKNVAKWLSSARIRNQAR